MKLPKMNLPNKLTLLRIFFLFPFLIFMAISYSSNETLSYKNFSSLKTISFFISGLIFTIAMFTDFADGFLARKNKDITMFGKLFDPLADKIITSSSLIMLSLMNLVPFYLVIILILRDVLVDGFRNLAASKKINVAASIFGKLKTSILSVGITLLFFIYPMFNETFKTFKVFTGHYSLFLLNFLIFVATFFSIFSGILYFNKIKKFIFIYNKDKLRD